MKTKNTEKQERLGTKKLPGSLCFQHCGDTDLPSDASQSKKLVAALKRFSNEQSLKGHDYHKLKEDGECKKVKWLMKQYPYSVYSIDVGKRNGCLGNYRLVFYTDPENPTIAKVLSIFLDDH
jgi:hypothetical protein